MGLGVGLVRADVGELTTLGAGLRVGPVGRRVCCTGEISTLGVTTGPEGIMGVSNGVPDRLAMTSAAIAASATAPAPTPAATLPLDRLPGGGGSMATVWAAAVSGAAAA
ncbi:hypothetical protein, partial [Allorhizocola rhizosphaerae]|uniref:hypothetical protein n=1 Tax=Allorhizocola rhizosphaerae TaxID=1872709 RepID=UPI0013C351F8